jgi:hypothetical protein
MQNKNRFTQNSATHDGGAIIWIGNKYIDDNTTVFSGNIAPYGDDVASYPKSLFVQFITNNDYYNPIGNS